MVHSFTILHLKISPELRRRWLQISAAKRTLLESSVVWTLAQRISGVINVGAMDNSSSVAIILLKTKPTNKENFSMFSAQFQAKNMLTLIA